LQGIVTRRVLPLALERMVDDPVVLLEGPRSVGKSTLLLAIAAERGARMIDLDDVATCDAVAADPATFVAGDRTVCIDEYQKAPVVLDAIKAELNRGSRPGRFVLTGSTRHDALPAAAQALTGRLSRLPIYPLSQGEIVGVQEDFLGRLLGDPEGVVRALPESTTTRDEYIERIVAGGFPLALSASTPAARNRWVDNYVALTLERDVRELSRVRQGHLLSSLLGRLAGQTAQVLNIDKAARDVGLDKAATDNYVSLLEKVFLVRRLPAWGKTLTSRSSSSPKLHVLDSGVAARLLLLTPRKLAQLDPTVLTELGHLLESFVVGELLKQASWLDDAAGSGHWRTYDGDEVDLVIERDDGALVAFEVKAGGRVQGKDLAPLRKLRNGVGKPFLAGVALYLGQRSYTFEERLHVMPVDRIWTPSA
jgi:predicted AAA+ superfamily ATPase